jgi:hypothetical protein
VRECGAGQMTRVLAGCERNWERGWQWQAGVDQQHMAGGAAWRSARHLDGMAGACQCTLVPGQQPSIGAAGLR